MKRREYRVIAHNDSKKEADYEIEFSFNGRVGGVIPMGRLEHGDPAVLYAMSLTTTLNKIQPEE